MVIAHQSAHLDRFVLDRLPPSDQQPEFLLDHPGYVYPDRLNAAVLLLDDAVSEGDGERVAVRNDSGNWTYREIGDRSNRIARILSDDGLVPGNRVLLLGANSAMLVTAWFAVLKCGGVVVTAIPMLRGGEIAKLIDRAEIDHAIVDAQCAQLLDDAVAATSRDVQRFVYAGDSGGGALEDRMGQTPADFLPIDTHRDDPALLAFTSGTSGVPKATVQYHRDLLIPADGFCRHILNAGRNDSFCSSAPLAFTFGLGALVLFPFRLRATTVTVEQGAPPKLLEAIERHRVTQLFTAPTAYKAMLPLLGEHDVSSLRECVSAGEHLPAATSDAWHAATDIRIVDGLGATEMMHIFLSAPAGAARAGATGRVVPGYVACVLDDAGRPLPEGTGRLAVKGPTGCRYLDDERQSTYVVNGWNVTGDTYRLDADGWFWFVARSDDMIVSSGYNIAAPEVESALYTHPAVAECAVVAVPDDGRGQIVKAFVVVAPGTVTDAAMVRTLQDHVKAMIAPYKYPRAIEFVAVLPKTPTGKVQRFALRKAKQ